MLTGRLAGSTMTMIAISCTSISICFGMKSRGHFVLILLALKPVAFIIKKSTAIGKKKNFSLLLACGYQHNHILHAQSTLFTDLGRKTQLDRVAGTMQAEDGTCVCSKHYCPLDPSLPTLSFLRGASVLSSLDSSRFAAKSV